MALPGGRQALEEIDNKEGLDALAAKSHAAGVVHAADSRRLDTSVSAAAAADDTP